MLRIFSYMLIWLGSWLLYFPSADINPVTNAAKMENIHTAKAQAGRPIPFSVIGSLLPADQFLLFFSGKSTVTEQVVWKPWFWGSGTAMLMLAIFLLTREKKEKLDRDREMLDKMRELEQTALRSQMNPHFIFNALNSIQGFIIDGDRKSSSRYLSKFSRLVRSTMHYSDVAKITLEQEIEMLRQYIELEQLRFHGKFNHQFKVHPSLNKKELQVPPLIIQPFVENAIKHGIGPKDGKGKIVVDFSPHKKDLLVTITDNGIGLTAAKKLKEKNRPRHLSMGMKVTRKRLHLLSSNKNNQKLNIRELVGEEGRIEGTQVQLIIASDLA